MTAATHPQSCNYNLGPWQLAHIAVSHGPRIAFCNIFSHLLEKNPLVKLDSDLQLRYLLKDHVIPLTAMTCLMTIIETVVKSNPVTCYLDLQLQ